MCGIECSLLTSCASGPSGEGAPETDVHAGHVWQEEGQSEKASSQTDQAGAASSSQTWSLHQIPSQFTWSVSTHPNLHHLFTECKAHLDPICTTLMITTIFVVLKVILPYSTFRLHFLQPLNTWLSGCLIYGLVSTQVLVNLPATS